MRARRQPLLDGAAALRVRRVLYLNGLRGGEIEPHIDEAGALSDMPEPRIAATDVKHQSLVG